MNSRQENQRKSITWRRIRRNLTRILKHCTPPVLHKPLGWDVESAGESPIPTEVHNDDAIEDVQFNLPISPPNEIWESFDHVPIKMFPGQLRHHLWAMPENELMVLSAVCRILQPQNVFEFGTFTGASTLAIAANSADGSKIHTLDIAPEQRKIHRTGVGSDIPFDFEIGQVFKGTSWESQIEILTGDARELDTQPFRHQMDLVFIDADHTYSFVKNDTAKALEMLKPGGTILWHDYRWDDVSPECAGVTKLVNEFHQSNGRCYEIDGTRFAIYQSPPAVPREAAA